MPHLPGCGAAESTRAYPGGTWSAVAGTEARRRTASTRETTRNPWSVDSVTVDSSGRGHAASTEESDSGTNRATTFIIRVIARGTGTALVHQLTTSARISRVTGWWAPVESTSRTTWRHVVSIRSA